MGAVESTTDESRPGSPKRICAGTRYDKTACTQASRYSCKDCGGAVCYDCAVSKPAFTSGYPMYDAGCPLCPSHRPEFVPYDRCEVWTFSGPHEPPRA